MAQTPLEIYDSTIVADSLLGVNPHVPVATLTSAVTLTGSSGAAFDFGVTTGDVTMEFILTGNPAAGASSFLAVGTGNPKSRLVYESWSDTEQLGFTQGGVADYLMTPAVASPKTPTHVAFVWDPAVRTMKVYVNGALAGSTPDVDASFAMPTGPGWLGAADANGDEGMTGTFYRVTVYDSILPDSVIKRHANAYGAHVNPALAAYDGVVAADAGNGLTPVVKVTSAVVLNGTGGADADFGVTSGDVTMEFILEGDPTANNSAFLAVGENNASSLRYEVWGLPNQIGFTQSRVADYNFSPAAASPTVPSHIAYAWNASTRTMKLYVNGVLAGTTEDVSADFAMPVGLGRLGAGSDNSERMLGTIYRVTTYDDLLSDAQILRHGKAFADLLSPPTILAFVVSPSSVAAGESATLAWDVKNANRVLVDGVDRTGTTNLLVSSPISSSHTLVAENALGKISKTIRLQVNPPLAAYDAAILADAAGGLTPVARLTTSVSLNGDWAGSPFDFGSTSGDVTMEFIVEGDPSTGSGTALATDYDEAGVWRHSLRYSQWDADGQLGLTKRAVADYAFSTPVPSPSWPTHVAFVWDSATTTLKVYVNGAMAGTKSDVDAGFAMPKGLGTLGEGMFGTVFRVTVYSGMLPESKIQSHGKAFLNAASPALSAYDNVIAAGAAPASRLLAPVVLGGDRGVTFAFGTIAGDGTIELILEGNPGASVSSFLAVDRNNPTSRLVYESWENTQQLGFTQGGVADYLMTPAVASPTTATHVAYAWNPATTTMAVYINGTLAGTTTGVDPAFALPTELGVLGNSLDGSEPMTGTIYRVTTYDTLLQSTVILSHAKAFTDSGKPPTVAMDLTGAFPVVILGQGGEGAHYRVEYRDSLAATDGWQLLQDIPSLTGTSVRVTDSTLTAGRAQRFYRAILVP